MKWIKILQKDKYALLQSENDTQYCVASGYDPTQPEDELIEDDRDSALEYFDECCEMTEEEKSFFEIEEDSPIANTKFENPMYNKGYDDGFADGTNSIEE